MVGGAIKLAFRSLSARRVPALLSAVAIALSVALLVTTEKVREGAREGFENTISGADLVVGARTGPLNLVLYTVFRLGDPLQAMSWETFEKLSTHQDVAWAIPMSLGDSHRGYRVLGTDRRYLDHYQYAGGASLSLEQGQWVGGARETVLGAEVARALDYTLGDEIVLSHGIISASFANHENHPFTVVGILAPTGTPVDRTVHVSLAGIEAMHGGDAVEPEGITAAVLGMKSRPLVLRFQRLINTYRAEPLTAAIPGVALAQLWSIVGPVEAVLRGVTLLVFVVGVMGLVTTLLASLAGRRREIAILRAVGARPGDLFTILTVETAMTTIVGVLIGFAISYGCLVAATPLLTAQFGIVLGPPWPGIFDAIIFGTMVGAGLLAGVVPGLAAYRQGLSDDLSAGS